MIKPLARLLKLSFNARDMARPAADISATKLAVEIPADFPVNNKSAKYNRTFITDRIKLETVFSIFARTAILFAISIISLTARRPKMNIATVLAIVMPVPVKNLKSNSLKASISNFVSTFSEKSKTAVCLLFFASRRFGRSRRTVWICA